VTVGSTAVSLAVTVGGAGSDVSLGMSNGSNDTTSINTILSANAGKTIRGVPGQTYLLNSVLTIKSGTTLDLTSCTISLTGSAGQILRNDAYLGVGPRDANITIIGGRWTRDATVSDNHMIIMHRVDGVVVQDATFASSHGKYAVLFGDCTRFTAQRLHMDTVYSDGVHVQGPSSQGLIDSITGTTGDDGVAITAYDYPAYVMTAGCGDVSDVTISNISIVNSASTGNTVKVLAGQGLKVRRVLVSGVRGTTSQNGVVVADDTLQAFTTGQDVDAITVRDVSVRTLAAAYSQVVIGGAGVKSVFVSNVVIPDSQTVWCAAVGLATGLTTGNISVSNVYTNTDTLDHRVVNMISSSAAVDVISLSNVIAKLHSSRSNGIVMNIAGTVGRVAMNNIIANFGQYMMLYQNTANLTVTATNITNGTGNGFYHNAASGTLTVVADGVDNLASCTLLVEVGSAGAITGIVGSIRNSGTLAYRSGSQVMRVNAPQAGTNLAVITGQAGDMLQNTNGSLSCGTGLCLFNGTNWKNLYTGATY
jgi:hypothetical protein